MNSLDSNDAPLEFIVSSSPEEYVDLAQTRLRIRCQILNDKNEALTATSTVAPVSNFLHSMFSNLNIELNQKCVTPQSGHYPYRAYIDHVLNYGTEVKESRLQTSLFFKDIGTMGAEEGNDGYEDRKAFSRTAFEMESHVHADIFNQEKYLLNGVQMNLKFYRSKPEFCLMADAAETGKFHVKIIDAILIVRKVRICTPVQLAHAATLQKFNAKYPITRTEIKTINLNKNVQNHVIDNVIFGQQPKRVVVLLVSSDGFNGNLITNPFRCETFNHNFMSIHTDTMVSSTPLKPDFPKKFYMSSYNSLFNGSGT